MDVRTLRAGVLLATICSLGVGQNSHGAQPSTIAGSVQSKHFIVTAPTTEFARQVCATAERCRHELAVEWLGHELPEWQDRCPIRVTVGPNLGAGGATSFCFVNGRPVDWQMTIQGSQERVLDSVVPHEITHTIFATHFGRPLPRWADEGAATSVEHVSERSKQHKLLIQHLTTDRGIPFNHMFAMKEYPKDILPLYSQGYSLARFLIALRGKPEFVHFVGDGMQWNNWTAATMKHYGLASLSALQVSWLNWVRQGSPSIVPETLLASHTRAPSAEPSFSHAINRQTHGGTTPLPGRLASARTDRTATQQGWYSRQRDMAAKTSTPSIQPSAVPAAQPINSTMPPVRQTGRAQTPQQPTQIALPPSRCSGSCCSVQPTVWR